MRMTSEAWRTVSPSRRVGAAAASSCRTRPSSPTSTTLAMRSRTAATAPSTSGAGAWSPPIASTATVRIGEA